jgi:hypothetical protein
MVKSNAFLHILPKFVMREPMKVKFGTLHFYPMCLVKTCNEGTHKANRYPHILISYVFPRLLMKKPRKMTRRKAFSKKRYKV